MRIPRRRPGRVHCEKEGPLCYLFLVPVCAILDYLDDLVNLMCCRELEESVEEFAGIRARGLRLESRRVLHLYQKALVRGLTPVQKFIVLRRLKATEDALPASWHRKALKGHKGLHYVLAKDLAVHLSHLDLETPDGVPETIRNFQNFGNSLTVLAMSHSKLIGDVPWTSVAALISLTELDLSCNRLTGVVQCQLPRNLVILRLHSNRFHGPLPIPPVKLQHCHLWSNKFSGSIPSAFGDLVDLETLWLHDNVLTGSIPAALSRCSRLEWCSLRDNRLTGVIPAEFGSLRDLKFLYVQRNDLDGRIPSFPHLTELKEFRFHDNPRLRPSRISCFASRILLNKLRRRPQRPPSKLTLDLLHVPPPDRVTEPSSSSLDGGF